MNLLRGRAETLLKRPDALPIYSIGCHGVQHGRCFMFHSKEDLEFAIKNMLEEDFFQNCIKKHPKVYFEMGIISGYNGSNQVITRDEKKEWKADEEWNNFVNGENLIL